MEIEELFRLENQLRLIERTLFQEGSLLNVWMRIKAARELLGNELREKLNEDSIHKGLNI